MIDNFQLSEEKTIKNNIFVGRLKIGHGLVLPDVGLSPTWQAREQDGSSNRGETEHQLKKYREVEFFGLLPPKPII